MAVGVTESAAIPAPAAGSEETEENSPDLDLFTKLKRWVMDGQEASSGWRKETRASYDLVAGEQWDSKAKAILDEQMRPAITFNRTEVVIDSVVGTEINNRQQTTYYPRELGDVGKNEVLTAAAQYFRQNCDAEDEESDAFRDLIICGMGWTETRLDMQDDPNGDAVIERVDPLEMGWDPECKRRNLAGSRYVYRLKTMPLGVAMDFLPGVAAEDLNAAWAGVERDTAYEDSPIKYLFQQDAGEKINRDRIITLVEIQWWELQNYWSVQRTDNGEVVDIEDNVYEKAVKRMNKLGIGFISVRRQRKVYRKAFLGRKILEKSDLIGKDAFTYQCMTGKRDHNKNTFYGIVRAMRDPQMWANKWLSQVMHIINSNAKGGVLAEEGAFKDRRKAEQDWAKPDAIIDLPVGGLAKIKERTATTLPVGVSQLLEFAVSSIRDVTGINLEMLGLADRDQSGVLEYQRRQSGMAILATFFDSLRQYRKKQGRVLLSIIINHLSDGRLVRIVGESGNAKYIPLLREQGVAEYDVIVDESPSSPNQKEMVWSMLVQMLPFLQQAPLPGEVWAELVRYSPLPDSLAQKIGQALNVPPDQAQAAFEQTMKQLTVASAQAQLQNIQSQTAENKADVVTKSAQAQKTVAEARKIGAQADNEILQNAINRLTTSLDVQDRKIEQVRSLIPAAPMPLQQ